MSDITITAATLAATLQPPRVRPFSGGATPTARATVGQTPPALAPGAPARPWTAHPMLQPLTTDKRVFRSVTALGGRIMIHVQAGKIALRTALAALGSDALTNGIDGHPVRLVQSSGKGPVIVASSDPKDVTDRHVAAVGAPVVPGVTVPAVGTALAAMADKGAGAVVAAVG